MNDKALQPAVHEIQIHLPGLIRILGETLYSDPEVAVREMIQNAHDSCLRRMAETDGFSSPRIDIEASPFERTLTFRDNGSGLTEPEIHEFLSTVGKGYTAELRKALGDKNREIAEKLIGRFGLGLLSAFIIAENIEIRTRSYKPKSKGFVWRCDGNITYTLEERPKNDVGTEVVIKVTSDYVDAMLNEEALKRVIKTYADFLSIPIFLNGSRSPLNVREAPWHRRATDAEYREYVRARYEDIPPLEVIPIQHKEDDLSVQGALYIPRHSMIEIRTYGDLDIYISRMFVCKGDRELLPVWAKFVRGVVDSPSLTPTLSRETVRKDDKYHRVQAVLSRAILDHFRKLASDDPKQFGEVVTSHNTLIKAWALEDDEFFDQICDLVLFDTEYGKMSLPVYFERFSEKEPGPATSRGEASGKRGEQVDETRAGVEGADRRRIYYFSEVGSGTQQKILFKEAGLCVIDASYGAEEAFLRKYDERHADVEVKKLDAGAGYVFENVDDLYGEWAGLEDEFRLRKIPARVTMFRPTDIPAVLLRASGDDDQEAAVRKLAEDADLNPELRKFFRQLLKERDSYRKGYLSGDAVLHLNASNPIIRQLAAGQRGDPIRELAMSVLFNNAVLFESHSVTPESAQVMFRTTNMAIERLMAAQKTIQELEAAQARKGVEHAESLEEQKQFARRQEEKAEAAAARVTEAETVIAELREEVARASGALKELDHQRQAEKENLRKQAEAAERAQADLRAANANLDAELAALRERVGGADALLKSLDTRPNDVFVMRPFASGVRWVYTQCIEPACREKGLTPINLEDKVYAGRIYDEIIRQIRECGILIADVTDANANVMYEVGAAHILGKSEQTILLAEDPGKLPFDTRSFSVIGYQNAPAVAALSANIKKALDSILARRRSARSA